MQMTFGGCEKSIGAGGTKGPGRSYYRRYGVYERGGFGSLPKGEFIECVDLGSLG